MGTRRVSVLLLLVAPLTVLPERPAKPARPSPAANSVPVPVAPGEDLQAVLDEGGIVTLQPGATYEASRFVISRPGTTVRGNGATVRGLQGPALHVAPGVSDVTIDNLIAFSAHDQAVIQLGDNDPRTQQALNQVPRRITLRRVTIPSHRGKRGIEVNAADVEILDGAVEDVWDPALRDSQAIWIGNTPGPVTVRGGRYSAGSEVILVGGDVMKLPDVVPSDLTFENLTLFRPMSWRTDGTRRAVKNLLELKTGHRVRVRDVSMEGSWREAQEGFAIMLTPTRGGSLVDLLFERVRIRHVTGGFNITGRDRYGISSIRTDGIVVRDLNLVTDRSLGGRGILALIGGGPGRIEFDRVVAVIDGTSLIHQSGPPMEHLALRDSHVVAGRYGLFLGGTPNAGKPSAGVRALEVRGNVIAGARPALERTLPDNRFVTRDAFDRMFGDDWQLKR